MSGHDLDVPDCGDFAKTQFHSFQLSDEDGGHGLVQCRTVHVDRGTDGHHESRYTNVDFIVFFQASHRDW